MKTQIVTNHATKGKVTKGCLKTNCNLFPFFPFRIQIEIKLAFNSGENLPLQIITRKLEAW